MKENSGINIKEEIIRYVGQSSKKRLLQLLTEHRNDITQKDIEGVFTVDGKVVNLFQYAIYKNYLPLVQFLIDKFPGAEKHCLLYLVKCKKDFSFNNYYASWIRLFSTYTLDEKEQNKLFKTYLPYFKRNRYGNSDSYRWYAGLVDILLKNLQYPVSVKLQADKYSTIEFFEKELRDLFNKQQDSREVISCLF